MKNEFWIFFTIAIAAIVISEATTTFETISDDDLVERIRANEFVIALFCKWTYLSEWPSNFCS